MKIIIKTYLAFFLLLLFLKPVNAQIVIDNNCNCVTTIMVGTKGGKLQKATDSATSFNGIIAAGNFGYGKPFTSGLDFSIKTTLDIIYVSKIGAINWGGGANYFFRQKTDAYSQKTKTVADALFYTRLGYVLPFLKKGFMGGYVNFGSVSQQSSSFSQGNVGFEAEVGYPFLVAKKKVDKINLSGVLNFQSLNFEGADYSNVSLSLRISVLQFWKRK